MAAVPLLVESRLWAGSSCMRSAIPSISRADHAGTLYAFQVKRTDPAMGETIIQMKVGIASNWKKRAFEWARQCPLETHVWVFIWQTQWYCCLERVVHLALGGPKRSVVPCPDCRQRHQEKFDVTLEELVPIVEKYGLIIDTMTR
ncbi:hypothetical protein B0H10DRAFT_2212763 [Mycena sp. CBHHK59/15]|nr:hypothetical protein B0H10DRAFT_2212763 [Mycena sp. CBHHK59/15]